MNAFQPAIKIKPEAVPSRYNLGLTFNLDGQYQKAHEVYRTVEKPDVAMAAKSGTGKAGGLKDLSRSKRLEELRRSPNDL
jgi:hypothetical protein